MARADLLKRLDDVETALGRPVVLGMWAHENGRPTYHHLAAKGIESRTAWFEDRRATPKGAILLL